jgi:DNA-directed RNA polymerase alpha subunit
MKQHGPGPDKRRTRRRVEPEWIQQLSPAEQSARQQESARQQSLADLGMTTRVVNCLERIGVFTVGDLADLSKEELLALPNFGSQTLQCCERLLDELQVPHQTWSQPVPSRRSRPKTKKKK